MDVRLIVDSNCLQDPLLRAYLSKSQGNYAVLNDYASMEAYKIEPKRTILKSMEILSEFPHQILVLKTTGVVAGLSGRSSGLARRMIDNVGTRRFLEFSKQLKAVRSGSRQFDKSIIELGREAEGHMDRLLNDARTIIEKYEGIVKSFKPVEIQMLRRGERLTRDMAAKVMDFTYGLAFDLMQAHTNVQRMPREGEIENRFIFRYSVCATLLWIRWIRNGNPKLTKPEKTRNDMVDMIFATYATYFDGILTLDNRLRELYEEATVILKLRGASIARSVVFQ